MSTLNLLLIETSESDANEIVGALSELGYAVTSRRVDTPDSLATAIATERWDLAIANYTLPAVSAERSLALVREYAGDLPFIFVSSAGSTPAASAIAKVDRIRLEWEAFFRTATDGRMTAVTNLR